MNAKELARTTLERLFVRAVERGAEPSALFSVLTRLEERMKASYRKGDLETALQIANEIGKTVQQERDTIDTKWINKFQEGYAGNPFKDPEYLQDFARLHTLDNWLEGYGSKGKNSELIRQYVEAVKHGEKNL